MVMGVTGGVLPPPLQPITHCESTNPQIRPSERNLISAPVYLVDLFLGIVLPGKAQMRDVWDHRN
jgi:hypothetical protein